MYFCCIQQRRKSQFSLAWASWSTLPYIVRFYVSSKNINCKETAPIEVLMGDKMRGRNTESKNRAIAKKAPEFVTASM